MSRGEMEKQGITILTGCTVAQGRQARQGIHHASVQRIEHRLRPGDVRDRPPSERRQSRPGEGRRRHQSEKRRHRGRCLLADVGAAHLCDRRRHPPPQSDAGRDPRGPRLCRHRVRQRARSRSITPTIPTAVFSQPEVGTVGLTEQEARAQFSHVDIYKAMFRPIKATMSGRDTRMLMKLVVDGDDRPRARLPHRRRCRRRDHPGGRRSR